jgi:hypothetical protein
MRYLQNTVWDMMMRNFKNLKKCSKNAGNSVEQGDVGHMIPNQG